MFFEPGKEEQKQFCLKLKNSYQHEKGIRYEIRSSIEPFSIKLKIKNFLYDITTTYIDNSEEEIQKTLNAIYYKLDNQ